MIEIKKPSAKRKFGGAATGRVGGAVLSIIGAVILYWNANIGITVLQGLWSDENILSNSMTWINRMSDDKLYSPTRTVETPSGIHKISGAQSGKLPVGEPTFTALGTATLAFIVAMARGGVAILPASIRRLRFAATLTALSLSMGFIIFNFFGGVAWQPAPQAILGAGLILAGMIFQDLMLYFEPLEVSKNEGAKKDRKTRRRARQVRTQDRRRARQVRTQDRRRARQDGKQDRQPAAEKQEV